MLNGQQTPNSLFIQIFKSLHISWVSDLIIQFVPYFNSTIAERWFNIISVTPALVSTCWQCQQTSFKHQQRLKIITLISEYLPTKFRKHNSRWSEGFDTQNYSGTTLLQNIRFMNVLYKSAKPYNTIIIKMRLNQRLIQNVHGTCI